MNTKHHSHGADRGAAGILIVGAGLGATRVASQLRQLGYGGPITALGGEEHLPYDRPPLSKQVLRGEADATTYQDLENLDVRWVLGTRALSLDPANARILADDDRAYGYDTLILAPGGRARTLPGLEPGQGVHVLRTIDDALALRREIIQGGRLVVIGGGFIGCEIAANARKIGAEVELIEALPAPLVRVLGPCAAAKVKRLHEAHGVRLHLGATIDEALREGAGQFGGVRLGDGTLLSAEAVVVGIGIVPDTDWLKSSGIDLQDGIVCDSSGRTSIPGVYALGDAAQWWHDLAGKHRRIEHWTTTVDQAEVVAANIMAAPGDPQKALTAAPYFWSDQYDLKIQGMGFIDPSDQVDELAIRDRPVLLYSRDSILRGVVGFSIPIAVMRTKPLIERGATVQEAIALLAS